MSGMQTSSPSEASAAEGALSTSAALQRAADPCRRIVWWWWGTMQSLAEIARTSARQRQVLQPDGSACQSGVPWAALRKRHLLCEGSHSGRWPTASVPRRAQGRVTSCRAANTLLRRFPWTGTRPTWCAGRRAGARGLAPHLALLRAQTPRARARAVSIAGLARC